MNCPHVRAGMKKRMYEVQKHFVSEADLTHFLNTTKKFGKRFYNVRGTTHRDKDDNAHNTLHVTAIAISRDLTYILKMNIHCKDPKFNTDEEDKTEKYPEFGWYPIDEEINKLYHPFAVENDYQDIFSYHGFHKVGSMRKDGIDILR